MSDMELEDFSDYEQNESESQTEELNLETNNYNQIADTYYSEEMNFTQCLPSNIIKVFSEASEKVNTLSNIAQKKCQGENNVINEVETKVTIKATIGNKELEDLSDKNESETVYEESRNHIQTSEICFQETNISDECQKVNIPPNTAQEKFQGDNIKIAKKDETKDTIKATMGNMDLEDLSDSEQNESETQTEEFDSEANNDIQSSDTYSPAINFTKCATSNLIKVINIERHIINTPLNIVQKKTQVQNKQTTKKVDAKQKVSKKLCNKKDVATQTTEQWPTKNTIIFKKVSENKENVFVNIEMANNNSLLNKRKRTIRLGLSKKWKCPEKYDE